MDREAKVKFIKNALYEIEFKDHSVGESHHFDCKAVGYVIEDNKDSVWFSCWVTKTDDEKVFKDNLESFVVLKSTIEKRRRL